MFKKIIGKYKQRKELKKIQRFYLLLQAGGAFLQYVHNDLNKMKKDKMNRSQRRRFEVQLEKQGKLSGEMVQYYKTKIDDILLKIDFQLKPKKNKMPKAKNVPIKK